MYNIRHRKGLGTWSVCVSEGGQARKLGWLEVRVRRRRTHGTKQERRQ